MENEIGPLRTYDVTDFSHNPKLLEEIRDLEARLRTELGEEITLISYSRNENHR